MLPKILILFIYLFSFTDCPSYYSRLLKKNVYTRVQEEPQFPGGEKQYQRFFFRNVRYPVAMMDEDNWQSTVLFTFIVDTDGKIKHPTFRGKDDSTYFNPLEKEVNRVIKLMPRWTPGKCHGKVVATEVKRSMVLCPERE